MLKIKKLKFFLILFLLILNGVAIYSYASKFSIKKNIINTRIYIYRPSNFVGSLAGYTIIKSSKNGIKEICKINNNSKIEIEVNETESIAIWLKKNRKEVIMLNLKNNTDYYLRFNINITTGKVKLIQMDSDKGSTEYEKIKKTQPSILID